MNEFNSNLVFSLSKREKSLTSFDFAIIAKDKHAITYRKFLKEKKIGHKSEIVSEYEIFWDFSGNKIEINKLRTLISY